MPVEDMPAGDVVGGAPCAGTAGPALVQAVVERHRLPLHGLHGVRHWLRVRWNGLRLARATLGADALVVEMFALLHDAERRDDGHDADHGKRAARLVGLLRRRGLLALDDARAKLLTEACAVHVGRGPVDDPTVGVCLDADRLDLSRLGVRPRDDLLSTRAAREDVAFREVAWTQGLRAWADEDGLRAWGLHDDLAGMLVGWDRG